MLLEGSSVRVLQCSPLPTDTGAVFNSFSKHSCLHAHCSLSSYLCPAVCFQEILFKQARTCHWNQLNFSDTSASWAHERISLFSQYRQGNLVKLCIFWVEPPFLHEGSFQLERCTTQGVVSVGRYQTEPRWFSSCTLSLEPSDTSMLSHECPLKHAAGGVICQGASMLPTSYWHGCRLQLLFQTVLPTYKLQLVFLSVSCRLLSRNSVQTSKDMSLEPVEFFRHICFLSAWKNLTFFSIQARESG